MTSREEMLDEADPTFCAMVNAARDEYIRLKGFAPYTADIIAMLKAALHSQAGSNEVVWLRFTKTHGSPVIAAEGDDGAVAFVPLSQSPPTNNDALPVLEVLKIARHVVAAAAQGKAVTIAAGHVLREIDAVLPREEQHG